MGGFENRCKEARPAVTAEKQITINQLQGTESRMCVDKASYTFFDVSLLLIFKRRA